MTDSIKVFAPATVANVVCGFDTLGFAVSQPGDEVILRRSSKPGVTINKITGDQGKLSKDPIKNTAGYALHQLLSKLNPHFGFEMELHKKMPFGSGLGSSAASAVAAVFAASKLLDHPLDKEELLPFTLLSEEMASGSPHADNVAPSLYGGFVLIRSCDPVDVIQLSYPSPLFCTIVHPQIEISTRNAREILRNQVELKEAAVQWANVGGLVAGLLQKDYDLIGRSMVDNIIEPVRSLLIPGFDEVRKSALDNGAIGAGISGSGPSIFALSKDDSSANKIGKAMLDEFTKQDIMGTIFVSQINPDGPLVLD